VEALLSRFDSKVRLLKGGEMMKTLVLVLALLIVGSAMCGAAGVTVDLYNKWNYIAAPCVPFNPDPISVFTGPSGAIDLDYYLYRYDAASQSMIVYDAIDPTGFGNCLLGDGYILYNHANVDNFSFNAVPDGVPDAGGAKTDMWISLPGNQLDGVSAGGWQLIGQPFNHDTASDLGSGTGDNIHFTDGTTLKTWDEAVAANWVDDTFNYYTGIDQSMKNITYNGLGDDDTFRAGNAYYVHTRIDNIAMIIPAN